MRLSLTNEERRVSNDVFEPIALFEEGMKKASECQAFLEQARQKVLLLSETTDGEEGKAWNPLEAGEA